MSLSLAEIEAIRAEAGRWPEKSAAVIEALKIVQQQRGWVSDDSVGAIAGLLGMSLAQVDSVASFYNLIYRKPVGKKVIHYCNSVVCWMLGADQNRECISRCLGIDVGETGTDGEYTLLPIVCLGACDKAPVLMIGEETHFNVDQTALKRILDGGGQGDG
ncbi:NADH-quinone oxidoreductase subunit NuoE [Candidatus Methylospira mobilis]|uniref:NADH-quinone oxidoreductase subunit E n=1 Tax=Candidatus Methylospira mobilis TaxID=1808979 RepID=A0A5Q0BDQ1_9GAMM|nr:NADH-quinone oxidoreductase subunit NuoE [Candidatus Methylospira mobilis]QFY41930.1 NADH-quinone oxidoreductase subunit NuoE [Candidatus Methylospira mobilis]WNV02918.1 NADH-quinone oxidoreductase subunit NuoE [Candidatus Methylospira mobilis]